MLLFAVLPAGFFVLTFVLLLRLSSLEKRAAFLWAMLVWTLVAVSMVEGLSLLTRLTPWFVVGGWGLVNVIVLGCLFVFPCRPQILRTGDFYKFSIGEFIAVFLIFCIVILVGVNAVFSAPNNWDSMTYHLPRVMHWIENQSVKHYSTAILRQLYQPPGAEFLILHFQILTQTDRFANLIQWVSMFGGVIVLSLLAFELGAGKFGQILAGLLAVTIPMGILQGSSTQNDQVVGFWLACFVYFLIRLLKNSQQTRRRKLDVLGAALSLAFALFTKGSAYVFAAPWLAWFILTGVFKKRRGLFYDVVFIAVVCLAVNAGFFSRNIRLFGTPLSAGAEDYVNKGAMIGNGVLNVVRNVALHLGTPSPIVNNFLKEKIVALQTLLGNAQNNSWGDFDVIWSSTSEDIAGNPLHFLLILFVFAFVLLSGRLSMLLREYVLLIILGFVLFCTFLKWQLFHSRLHLPLFLLSMPVVGLVLEKMRPRVLLAAIIGILVLAAIPPLFYNERHPLIGKRNIFNTDRMEQYFFYRKFMALPYVLAVKYAVFRNNLDVGVLLSVDDWEYPLWVLLKKENPDIRIGHCGVKNVSGSLARAGDKAAVVISELDNPPAFFSLEGKIYLKRQQFSFMSVYEGIKR